MIRWKKDAKLYNGNKWFDRIKSIREKMIDEILNLNKEQKEFKAQYKTKGFWRGSSTELILTALNDLRIKQRLIKKNKNKIK
jgi:hypothetical protein